MLAASTEPWGKAIDRRRDALQSRGLVMAVAPVLAVAAAWASWRNASPWTCTLCLAAAVLVWRMRSATPDAAAVGALICLILAQPAWFTSIRPPAVTPQIAGLITLFGFTFAATRFGRSRKEARGLAESRRGRRASQVVANLGVAALCGALLRTRGDLAAMASIAALAEATADTLSSEIGQALGGTAWMLTTGRRVPAGTDGGISLWGTMAGLSGAGAVIAATMPHSLPISLAVFAAATSGLIFDSWLGATVERRGWLGNDLVNFSSTAFAAGISALLIPLIPRV